MSFSKNDDGVEIPLVMAEAINYESTTFFTNNDTSIDPLQSGFKWCKPNTSVLSERHEQGGHEWAISGHDMQVLTVTVPPGETLTTEVGSFMFMHPSMETEVELTCCSSRGENGCYRILGGESCVKVYLVNEANPDGYAGVTPNFPAKIVPVRLSKDIKPTSSLIGKGGVIMTQLGDVNVGCSLDCGLATCCCAGLGACRQKLDGDGVAFLAAGGTIVKKELGADETIVVDSSSVVAYEDTITLGITPSGRICMCCIGGEGIFNTTLTGPGQLWMQSMCFPKYQAAVQQTIYRDSSAGASGVAGDVVGNFFDSMGDE